MSCASLESGFGRRRGTTHNSVRSQVGTQLAQLREGVGGPALEVVERRQRERLGGHGQPKAAQGALAGPPDESRSEADSGDDSDSRAGSSEHAAGHGDPDAYADEWSCDDAESREVSGSSGEQPRLLLLLLLLCV